MTFYALHLIWIPVVGGIAVFLGLVVVTVKALLEMFSND